MYLKALPLVIIILVSLVTPGFAHLTAIDDEKSPLGMTFLDSNDEFLARLDNPIWVSYQGYGYNVTLNVTSRDSNATDLFDYQEHNLTAPFWLEIPASKRTVSVNVALYDPAGLRGTLDVWGYNVSKNADYTISGHLHQYYQSKLSSTNLKGVMLWIFVKQPVIYDYLPNYPSLRYFENKLRSIGVKSYYLPGRSTPILLN